MFVLMLRKSRAEEEIEAMYIRKRFQGLSLEDQRKMRRGGNKLKKITRRRSSAADSKGSQITPNSRRARVTRANPFGLQEWQLKLSGIDLDVDTEETDIDGDEELNRKPMGAINPLMMTGVDPDDTADYDPVPVRTKQPTKKATPTSRLQPTSRTRLHSNNIAIPVPQHEELESDSDASSDSFNPYD